ncbi:o-succinylbenzoate--CoA ligase [Halovenus sp. WSH3]|uniref:O-succinylbenzoate--CoA ligase n=1 Tax=Halovenus carboxidivorans TaxID=2692199 RepID=A0A6B0T9A8_9EURY|nr:o-succinylbenzoate--CoA ligase [Halovenus carboxidivorans]MXR51450.1 o-succinylbenzoate--CoA ligase [Halovenus carboxidivorans]
MFGTDLLRTRADATPDRIALSAAEGDEQLTYRELDTAVTEMAAALDSVGTDRPDPRLAVALPTGVPFVCVTHAALRLGWELIPLNTRLSEAELATRIDRVEPDLLLCGQETEQLLVEAERRRSPAREPAYLSVDDPGSPSFRPLPSPASKPTATPHAPDDTALVLFTSGTTGEPKGVRLTVGNLTASAVASAFRLGVTPTDRWLCCLPMYHMGGLAPVFRSALYGTTLVLQPAFDAEATAAVLNEDGITGVSLVPTQLGRLLDVGFSAPELRTVLLGGAPASESLLDRAADAGVPVYPTYGMTETASQVATARPAEHRDHPGTVGQPLYGTSVAVVDPDGDPVDPGGRGEVVVSGPTVTPGYLDPERTAEATSSLGLHTGDLGTCDEDGRLWILGRLDETIITGGELVAPATVAEAIRDLSAVADVAVVGIEDEEWGEQVAAAIVPSGSHESDRELREQVERHCRERLADYKIPRRIRFVESLPRTQSGTVERERLRELFE